MRFDDDWSQEQVLDAYSISDTEYRFDRVETCTVICTDIVGGARLFETLPRDAFTALLDRYLDQVRDAFGHEHLYHTLRDDIFIAVIGLSDVPLRRALAFRERLQTPGGLPFSCSVGISSGDVAILTCGDRVEPQGAPIAIAKGLAKIASGGALFIDQATALRLQAAALAPLSPARPVRLPHVGQVLPVHEILGSHGALGLKARFLRPALAAPPPAHPHVGI